MPRDTVNHKCIQIPLSINKCLYTYVNIIHTYIDVYIYTDIGYMHRSRMEQPRSTNNLLANPRRGAYGH